MAGPFRKALCAGLMLPGRVPVLGRPFRELARVLAGAYKDRRFLAGLWPWPWISPRAEWSVRGPVRVGRGVFVDDGCVVYGRDPAAPLVLGDRVSLYRGTVIHLGEGGSLAIGDDTHVQNDVIITAFGRVAIGRQVQIAPRCSFYPYDHGFADPGAAIQEQPLRRRGGITVEDDVWIGVGATVLDGVTIGRGAVVGAGAVVTGDVEPFAIVAGVPARVIGRRAPVAEAR